MNTQMDTMEKLRILSDAAKYDAACTSSGVNRAGVKGQLGSAAACGICHSFASDGRCISLLKVLMTNICAYDCTYCLNRRSNDTPRATFRPQELADLTISFYRRNYIEGLFLSSAVFGSPDITCERMLETLHILRNEYHFNGYIHVKAIPGADETLLQQLGLLADRMSVNIELPSNDSLKRLAPQKSKENILLPMSRIRDGIKENAHDLIRYKSAPRFVPGGQSTQMIIGATPETDFQILNLSSSLYKTMHMKRVFFSAYLSVNEDGRLPQGNAVQLAREHRLYQADWLMRFYKFDAAELIDEGQPFLATDIDPKANWAINHLDRFPIEVNTAPYEELLRVPGIGVRGAKAIVGARRATTLGEAELRKLGVAYKRARFFITCRGRYQGHGTRFDKESLHAQLAAPIQAGSHGRRSGKVLAGQMSLFDGIG